MVHFHWIQIYFNLPYIFIRLSLYVKSGNLNFLEPSGPLQACNGTASLYVEVSQNKLKGMYFWVCVFIHNMNNSHLIVLLSHYFCM